MARRTRRVGLVLQAMPKLVPSVPTRRVKERGAWVIVAMNTDNSAVTLVTVNTYTTGRTLQQLAEPIRVHVHRHDLVDGAALHQLERSGIVLVVPAGSDAS
jgi:hypothetical protein